jgi:peptide/nickel transport system ATP-binding protein
MTANDHRDPAATPLLDVRDLKMWFSLRSGFFDKTVGHVKAVDSLSFQIFRGETVGLVGESGCGKTTVGRCIVRAHDPTAGQILYHKARWSTWRHWNAAIFAATGRKSA